MKPTRGEEEAPMVKEACLPHEHISHDGPRHWRDALIQSKWFWLCVMGGVILTTFVTWIIVNTRGRMIFVQDGVPLAGKDFSIAPFDDSWMYEFPPKKIEPPIPKEIIHGTLDAEGAYVFGWRSWARSGYYEVDIKNNKVGEVGRIVSRPPTFGIRVYKAKSLPPSSGSIEAYDVISFGVFSWRRPCEDALMFTEYYYF